jgi:hypothetical protein
MSDKKGLLSWKNTNLFTPLEMPPAAARGKLKNSYTFSRRVNAPCAILLTGFSENLTIVFLEVIILKNIAKGLTIY